MNIVFIAPPAAGKGTQAKLLQDKYNLYHLSTGDLLREVANSGTELGNEVKNLIDNGIFVNDELMLKLLKNKIETLTNSNGIIFDGFPRTVVQAGMLDNLLNEKGQKINHVIALEIDKEKAMKRAIGRVTCTDCGAIWNTYTDNIKNEGICNTCGSKLEKREDDTEEKFNSRFDTYIEKTKPLIDYYKDSGVFKQIECADEREETFARIQEVLENND